MKTPVFVSFCLLIVTTLVALQAYYHDGFQPTDKLKEHLHSMAEERAAAQLRAKILQDELNDYQQQVATLLPEAIRAKGLKDPASYPLRQLASVAAEGEADPLEIERASGLFESAKSSFRDQDFAGSNARLEKLIALYPLSAHVIEAHFLLAEGQYQLKQYSESIKTIERMINLYPENDLTGFALLRLGDIFKGQDRLEDAGDIYRAVIANFRQPELLRQANHNLQDMQEAAL